MRNVVVPAAVHKDLSQAAERFEHRLADETGKLRRDFAGMKSDLLKWSFLFWLGQVAVMAALLGLVLQPRG